MCNEIMSVRVCYQHTGIYDLIHLPFISTNDDDYFPENNDIRLLLPVHQCIVESKTFSLLVIKRVSRYSIKGFDQTSYFLSMKRSLTGYTIINKPNEGHESIITHQKSPVNNLP